MSVFPSVKNLPLSETRVNYVIKEMIDRFNEISIIKKLIKNVRVHTQSLEDSGFVTVGFNSIVDRIWFVDTSGDSIYDYRGIGADFAEGIAEAETGYLVKCILSASANSRSFTGTIKPADILDSLQAFESGKTKALIVLTNVRDHVQLWHYPELQSKGKLCVPSALSKLGHDVEIEFLRSLPEGTSIVLDSERLGNLLVKKSIQDTANILEIKEPEYAKILKEISELTAEQLPEKVRVRAYETVKVDIVNSNAAVILKQKHSCAK